jgi:tetratricopeptide (TPR) repeat protein
LGNLLNDFAGHEKLGEVVHEVVEEYRDAGLYEESRGLFAYLLENWDETADTMLELQVGVALQSIKLGELEKAQSATDQLIADYNDHPRIAKALFQIGEEHFYAGNYEEVIGLLELIDSNYPSRDFPSKSELPFVLATSCKRIRDWNKAIEYYERSVEEYPGSTYAAWSPYNIGWIYAHGKRDYENAIHWFEQQRALYPEDDSSSAALFQMECIYVHELKDYEKGAETCEEYLGAYPNGIDAYGSLSNLGRCYVKLGETEMALAALEEAYDLAVSEGLRRSIAARIAPLQEGGAQ